MGPLTNTMDPPRFVDHYRTLFIGMRNCGLSTPWLHRSSFLAKLPYKTYNALLYTIMIYVLGCNIYSVANYSISFQDLCSVGVSSSNLICAILVTFFIGRYDRRLKRITDNIDKIAETILTSDLAGSVFYRHSYEKKAKLMAILTNNSVYPSFALPLVYFSTVPATDWVEGRYRERTPLPIFNPFINERLPGVYELISLVMMCGIAYSTAKKAATDCLFVILFNIQSDFLKYLSQAINALQNEWRADNNTLARKKLITWLKLHQDIITNIHELIEIFSPIGVIYYMTLIGIVVCGAFIQLMKENEHIIQTITIGFYIIITLVYQFLLSYSADEVTTEAQKLAFATYCMPWYEMSKADATIIQLVVAISNRPVQVTSYRAPTFLLNRDTYAKFLVGAISAFVTLCQMMALYDV